MSLYTYRSTGYITKWSRDGNVEASYQTSDEGCTCPAGHRDRCRHRIMLPNLRPIADTHWFYDYDRNEVVDMLGTPKATLDALIAPIVCAPAEQDTSAEAKVWATVLNENVVAVHNNVPIIEVQTLPTSWRRL